MPARDKTGPLGTGPIGRGKGGCQQSNPEEPATQGMKGRCRGGNGHGQGHRQGCCRRGGIDQAQLAPQEEAAMLEKKISSMQARLDELKASKPKA